MYSELHERMVKVNETRLNEKLAKCRRCGGDAELYNTGKKATSGNFKGSWTGDWVAACKQCDNEYHGCDYKPWTVKNWNKQNESVVAEATHFHNAVANPDGKPSVSGVSRESKVEEQVKMCPRCGDELQIVDVTPDGYDVYGCPNKECGYRDDEEG